MKCSDALALGATSGQKPNNFSWETCSIGIACNAVGVFRDCRGEAEKRWPWLQRLYPPPNRNYAISTGFEIFSYFTSDIETGKATLEDLIAWVKSVEPEEEWKIEPKSSPADVPESIASPMAAD